MPQAGMAYRVAIVADVLAIAVVVSSYGPFAKAKMVIVSPNTPMRSSYDAMVLPKNTFGLSIRLCLDAYSAKRHSNGALVDAKHALVESVAPIVDAVGVVVLSNSACIASSSAIIASAAGPLQTATHGVGAIRGEPTSVPPFTNSQRMAIRTPGTFIVL